MKNLTDEIGSELLGKIKQITGHPGKILVLGVSSDANEEMCYYWYEFLKRHPTWTFQTLDEEVAERFGVSARTVRRARQCKVKLS